MHEEPGPVAQAALREGDFVAAKMIRRLVDGNLLVRLAEGQVIMLGPKETCSWCWIPIQNRIRRTRRAVGRFTQSQRRTHCLLEWGPRRCLLARWGRALLSVKTQAAPG